MHLRFLILLLCISTLFSCSSSVGRAPVSDITLATNTRSATDLASRLQKKSNFNQKKYTVKKGDTLYAIAWKTGGSVNSLIKRNNLKAPYIIKKGQVLDLTDEKRHSVEKTKINSDLPLENVTKMRSVACTAQNCQKNKQMEVVQQKTKAYSGNKVNKKLIATKSKQIKNESLKNKKVSAWSWPVKGKLTKRFSASPSAMQGISIVNDRGTPIHAAAPGKVVYAGSGLRGYGKLIIIKHNDDYLSAYAHNETLLVGENTPIKMGQKIAVMGDSGTDNVRLHFEIRYRGKSVDPLRYLPKR